MKTKTLFVLGMALLVATSTAHADGLRPPPPYVHIFVTKAKTARGVLYRYEVFNRSAFPIFQIHIGWSGFGDEPFGLTLPPLGAEQGTIPASSAESPFGWSCELLRAEEDTLVALEWAPDTTVVQDPSKVEIQGGGKWQGGFGVLVAEENPSYETAKWSALSHQGTHSGSLEPGDLAPRIRLRLDTSEAESVLAIVSARGAVSQRAWDGLFATTPYRRLHAREEQMQRAFTDSSFQAFVLSDSLAQRAPALRRTLARWKSANLTAGAQRVLAYLPPEARIRASVYPVIKPRSNSFVFDVTGDPAIFLFVDPEQSAAKFDNTVAHELHHIGFSSISSMRDSAQAGMPDSVAAAVMWMGAFGEGFAMLAAAGDAGTHPHAVSPWKERTRWDRDMTHFNADLRSLDSFFVDVIEGRLRGEDAIRERAFSFYGEQGPWYTVGYRMAVTVERAYGRPALIACMIDPRRLLARYNEAAAALNAKTRGAGGEPLALWSERLLSLVTPGDGR